ncbi:MAG: hypothetical protein M3126_09775 [Candidatus Eremiobacteraeota bacterium]|nr:hypothetical protein [Candidatus Eremiobacteraeota bacterium]
MPVLIAAVACIVAVLAQDFFPAQPWYHQGSYAVLLMALIAWQWWMVRRYRTYLLLCAGATLVGVAGIACSLFAPDPQTIVRGPGESIPLSEPSGVLQFGVAVPPQAPVFERPGRAAVSIGVSGRRTYLAAFILWTKPRTSASVAAFDSHGARLTITQPLNTSFLSPVLLFANTAPIGGRNLPVDSFAVPAAHRNVKAVLLTDPRPGVLFAVEDERGALIPGGIAMAGAGEIVHAGGIGLRASLQPFPEVIVTPAPYLPLVIPGVLLAAFGLFRNRFRSRNETLRSALPEPR